MLNHLTVILISAGVTFGGELDVMVAEPMAKPVNRTVRLVEFAGNVTVGGAVATAALLEVKLTGKLVGTGAKRVNVTYWEPPALIVTPLG